MRKWFSNMDVESGDIVKLLMPEILPYGMQPRMYEAEYLAIVPVEAKYLYKYTIELIPRCKSNKKCKCTNLYTTSDSSTLLIVCKNNEVKNEDANS